jgi:hypothetical protein
MPAVASLWSPDIQSTALSPFAILEEQAQALGEQTNGLLVGDVKLVKDNEAGSTRLTLDLVAPLLSNYRRRILTVTHRIDMIYPARVDADCFRGNPVAEMAEMLTASSPFFTPKKQKNDASSDKEFRELVEQVLQSHEVTSVAVSLIAQINDVLKERERQAAKASTLLGSVASQNAPPTENGSSDVSDQ